jgi:hypothetical protein
MFNTSSDYVHYRHRRWIAIRSAASNFKIDSKYYANRRSSEGFQKARTAAREEKEIENEFFEVAEGIIYGPGIAD